MAKLNPRDEARRANRDAGTASPGDYSEALERGLLVLAAFEPGEERLTQSDLSRKLGIPRATVRRALLTLVHMGYVIPENRSYRLAPKVLALASAYLTTNPVSRVLQPTCDDLCEEFGTSCTAAVLDGPAAVMIARALPRQALAVGQGIGFRVPATRSALGRVLISALDDDQFQRYMREHESQHDPAAVAEIAAELSSVREQGYAYVAHEVEAGFHSIAVPLRRWDDTQVAALNIGSSVEHLSQADMFERVLPVLQAVTRKIQSQLV
ncbi:helix-turn-helix domain-containing protein [Saccharopolyspora sp. K220]|uniref:IclR family transcriptional regulator domain-containing protein n=1 Tax=Saccharopolyspora soli TaxID=2926618 RepID=UPI001F5ABEFA|nr:IclR family transcriptional regulator C-terminal domain-containing protein [Saccharopolyspora soli]MCI2420913.1 helix-turn-helix domain-containing protein [Saccharopolyspora soli]